jgi:Cft2 family RNA processing exonuclease
MGGKKKDFKIIVKSLGNSTTGVTGSMWTIEYPKNDGSKGLIAIECGLCQSEPTTEKLYNSNKKMLENIGKDVVKKCEYVFLGHQHVDHLGNLVYFCRDNGFQGKILGSKETIEIGKELIKDSVYIHKKSVEYLNSKGIKAKILYTQSQMYEMFEHMESVIIGEKIKLNENLSVEFRYNSHTIGSTNITLIFTKPNNEKKVICYSSDMGSQVNKKFSYYLKEQDIPLRCNLFISEATYSDYSRQMTKEMAIREREDMKNMIKEAILHNKRVLLPVFAFSKAQLMVTLLWEWFHEERWFNNIPVVMDGLLMSNINSAYTHVLEDEDKKLFDEVMEWKNLKINKMYDSTIATLSQRTCGVYLVSSGFLKEGRITTYLPQFLESSNDIIAINGYCGDENSRGGQLLNKAVDVIKIDKQFIQKRCQILQYKSFSSHITRQELLELWSKLCCDKIVIHHCDNKNKDCIINDANDYLRSKNKTTKIVTVDKDNYVFEL